MSLSDIVLILFCVLVASDDLIPRLAATTAVEIDGSMEAERGKRSGGESVKEVQEQKPSEFLALVLAFGWVSCLLARVRNLGIESRNRR
jgi:hypothetical protein